MKTVLSDSFQIVYFRKESENYVRGRGHWSIS